MTPNSKQTRKPEADQVSVIYVNYFVGSTSDGLLLHSDQRVEFIYSQTVNNDC